MAFKDLQNYYFKTKANYFKALKHVEDFDKAHKEGVIEDEAFERFKRHIEKLKDTYDMVCCFFTIWAKPDEEEKKKSEEFDEMKESGSNEMYDYLRFRNPDQLLKEQDDIIKDIEEYLESKRK